MTVFTFIAICIAAIPVQVLVFLLAMKIGGRPGLLAYFGLIGLPLAICLGAGLLPFALGLNETTPVWDLFQAIVGSVTLLLILLGFGFGVILRRKSEDAIHPWNIVGLMVLVGTPLILVAGAVIIAYFNATVPVIFSLGLYLLIGLFLMVKRWGDDNPDNTDGVN